MRNTKIKSVEEYIKIIQNLQNTLNNTFCNEQTYLINENKEFSIALIKKLTTDNNFKKDYSEFIKNFNKLLVLISHFENENSYVQQERLKDYLLTYKNELTGDNTDFYNFISKINPDLANELKSNLNENIELSNTITDFLNKYSGFIDEYWCNTQPSIFGRILNGSENSKLEYFFRGQSDSEHGLLASVYRKNLKDNEASIMNMTLADKFDEFSDCKTMYEKLVKMQHYGIPTRVLDLTSNSLTALYFACEGNTKKDGAVFLFSTLSENVCFPDSDKVRVLSNLSKINNFKYCNTGAFENIYQFVTSRFYKFLYLMFYTYDINTEFVLNDDVVSAIDSALENTTLNLNYLDSHMIYFYNLFLCYLSKSFYTTKFQLHLPDTYRIFRRKLHENINSSEYINIDNNSVNAIYNELNFYIGQSSCSTCNQKSNCSEKLVNQIREEKPSFESRIVASDLAKWRIVRGAKNNIRIKSQDGHFIIVPKIVEDHKKAKILEISKRKFDNAGFEIIPKVNDLSADEYALLAKDSQQEDFNNFKKHSLINEPMVLKLVIDEKHKSKILKQLSSMGINKATVYPELNSYGDYIKEIYNKKNGV